MRSSSLRAERLKRGDRLPLAAVGLGVWITGVIWLLFHYCLRRPSPFGYQANPLEHWWLALHGAFAFAAIAMLGFLWRAHIVRAWASGACRRSGVALLSVVIFLVLTGYLLYYANDDDLRGWVALAHWSVGLAAPAAFVGHRYARVFSRRA